MRALEEIKKDLESQMKRVAETRQKLQEEEKNYKILFKEYKESLGIGIKKK